MTLNLSKRLAALEANQPAVPLRSTPEEAAEAARRYEATLNEDDPTTPEAEAYFANVTLKQITADYDAILKGAAAPWERM
jgi:hypothetical protein